MMALVSRLGKMTASQRAQLPGVSQGRAPQLLAGAIVADAAMETLGVEQLDICPWALREGVILRRLDWISAG
jgi:exopolyphosphatase/guanosine-5'-triphosphate,3'-diphosphate pyrophosphatase